MRKELVDSFLNELESEQKETLDNINAADLTPREWHKRRMKQKEERRQKYKQHGYTGTHNHPLLDAITNESEENA